jgi:adenylosuccinate lyase
MWRYISDGVFLQQQNTAEVGSSTMPQKINPIDFENSEGNLGLANALMTFFIQKLPISRLQRDLSDSTVKRNFGSALGYSILAYKSLEKGLKKIELNNEKINQELNDHWEVVTEGLQTVLRTEGHTDAYEQLKDFSRGNHLNQKNVSEFIESLSVSTEVKKRLKAITPQTYTGYAHRIVIENSPRINLYLKESND